MNGNIHMDAERGNSWKKWTATKRCLASPSWTSNLARRCSAGSTASARRRQVLLGSWVRPDPDRSRTGGRGLFRIHVQAGSRGRVVVSGSGFLFCSGESGSPQDSLAQRFVDALAFPGCAIGSEFSPGSKFTGASVECHTSPREALYAFREV